MVSESPSTPVLAVCGKGGVGKTAVSALLGRALRERGRTPLLLIDADPVGGLCSAVGARPARTLAQVRTALVARARGSDEATRQQLADELDYRVLEALLEKDDYALLAMGRSQERGCFCPVNSLLRQALGALARLFAMVLVDAEAGVEQIQREVTREVTRLLVVVDGSQRSRDTLAAIAELVDPARLAVVENRWRPGPGPALPVDVPVVGRLPEDDVLRAFDAEGRPLWQLPGTSPALQAAHALAEALDGLLAGATPAPPPSAEPTPPPSAEPGGPEPRP